MITIALIIAALVIGLLISLGLGGALSESARSNEYNAGQKPAPRKGGGRET